MPSPEAEVAYPFVKGHGTENDFVLLPDLDGHLHGGLDEAAWAARVRALCDRRAGLGGDGVLRVVRADGAQAAWFMDYRNADGSIAEMCGNGVRVFVRYLLDAGLVPPGDPVPVATRAGVKTVTLEPDGRLSATMGVPQVLGRTEVSVGDRTWPATHVDLGNPHAVVLLDDGGADTGLDTAGDLLTPPRHDPAVYPDGVNVEFVVTRGEGHLAMRVHERGSGETRSCGTGACAVHVAAAGAPGTSSEIDVPGGRLTVTWRVADDGGPGEVVLTGPAVLVAEGTTTL